MSQSDTRLVVSSAKQLEAATAAPVAADSRQWTLAAALVAIVFSVAAIGAWALDHPLRLTSWSGAMLPQTAVACLALACGLLLSARGTVTAASWCAVAVLALAVAALVSRVLGFDDHVGNLVAQGLGHGQPRGWRIATTTAIGLCAAGAGLLLVSAARARRPLLLAAGLCGVFVGVLGLAEAIVAFRSWSPLDVWRFGGSMALPTALTLTAIGVGLTSLALSRRLAPDATELGTPLLVAGVCLAGTFALAHAVAIGETDLFREAAHREAQRLADLIAIDVERGAFARDASAPLDPAAVEGWLGRRAPDDYVVSLVRDGRLIARVTRAKRVASEPLESVEAQGLAGSAAVAGSAGRWLVRAVPVTAIVEQRGSRLPVIVLALGLAIAIASASSVAAARSVQRRMESERAANAARVESEARWRAVNESSPVGIYFATTAGECLFVNPACRAIMGVDATQAIGFGWTEFIHPEDRVRVFAEFEASRLEGRDFGCEYRMVRPGGGITWVSVRAALARDGDRALGIVGTVEDISERRRAEEQSRLRLRELETLLTVSSHDLQEPLRAMSGLASALHEDFATELGDEGRDLLERLARGAGRMSELVEAIGTVVRVQALTVPHQMVDGAQTVEATLRDLGDEIRRTGARVEVVGPFPLMQGDPPHIKAALTHLVANALKFVPEGQAPELEIAAFATSEMQETGFIVRDRGPGVPPEHEELIFRLFRRAVGREVQGLGVGLAIARAVAERHGGRAFVRPREGGGSEFGVTFGAGTWPTRSGAA